MNARTHTGTHTGTFMPTEYEDMGLSFLSRLVKGPESTFDHYFRIYFFPDWPWQTDTYTDTRKYALVWIFYFNRLRVILAIAVHVYHIHMQTNTMGI